MQILICNKMASTLFQLGLSVFLAAALRRFTTLQTVMEMKHADHGDMPAKLSWMWTCEAMKDTLGGKGKFRAGQLVEQKRATSDTR